MERIPDYIEPYYKNHTSSDARYSFASVRRKLRLFISNIIADDALVIPGIIQTGSYNEANGYMAGDAFTPQGLCIVEGYVLVTAYDHNNQLDSVVYVIDNNTGAPVTTIIVPSKAHVGGIAFDNVNNLIWISKGTSVGCFSKDDLLAMINTAKSSDDICGFRLTKYKYVCKALTQTSFLSFYNNLLWIGRFDRKKKDIVYGYKPDIINECLQPVFSMVVPAKAQGITFFERMGKTNMIVSCSYSCSPSSLKYYIVEPFPDSSYESNIKMLNCSYSRRRIIPSMSEGIEIFNNRLYVLFESAALPYHHNKLILSMDRIIKYRI